MENDSGIEVKIEAHTDELIAELDRLIPLALEQVGELVEGKAKRNCPVDTGYLRNSITYALAGERTKISEYKADKSKVEGEDVRKGTYEGTMPEETEGKYAVYIGSNVEYAAAVEMRDVSHKVGQAHFIRDALNKQRPKIKATIQTVLGG